jgi:fructosamine-3-kinase
MQTSPIPRFETFLRQNGLLNPSETATFSPLEGGVSSDIWRVDTPNNTLCIKAALAKLKVEMDWYAPVERNAYEVAWMRKANQIVPDSAPDILADDAKNGLFAMTYLPPGTFPNWKNQLRDGITDPDFSRSVGQTISQIHFSTKNDTTIQQQFQTGHIFHAIRLEPYLEATAAVHPDLHAPLMALSDITARTECALVHGDVSPKNILVGPDGPKFLDAECAWYGDPAFDLAFCLNHFLLKCLWKPKFRQGYLSCFDAMVAGYRDGGGETDVVDIQVRAARLLPGLMLGRIDGRSPVEYLTDPDHKNRVRRVSTDLLKSPPADLSEVRRRWHDDLNS